MQNTNPNSNSEKEPKQEPSLKEKRIREITFIYYSRQDIKKAIFEFSQNRECIPRYYEGFGKRPDIFQYESDILEHVKKGATSFHCSEELWADPLEISTELSEKEFNDLRIGWDLLLDIDSPYLEYSKIYTHLLIETLRFHGIKNFAVKFSVTGDTDILIKNNKTIKLIPIKEVIELLKKEERLEVLSLDRNKKIKFSKIYDYLEHEDVIYNLYHSQSKVPIKATRYHSVFVWDKGDILQKKVTDLKIGDFLISFNCKDNPFIRKNNKLIFEYEFSKNKFIKNIFKDEIKLTPELIRLIGYFLAEGHITKTIYQTGFTFNIDEKEYIEDCKNILYKITKRKISIRHPNTSSTQILIHSKKWHDFFKKYCGEKKEKHIPNFSWNLSKSLFLEMLKGYIRGDGYKIDKYGIIVKSVSKRLIKEFIWLCKLNNISCSLSSEQNKPHQLPQGNIFPGSFVYILKIPKSELSIREFNRERNKFSPYPGDKIFPTDGLRLVYNKIKPGMFNYHRPEEMTIKKKRANLNRIKKVLNWFEKYGTVEKNRECKKIIENYKLLFDSDISIVEVRSIIKKGKEKVYDVSVDETESFFGNDYPILLHNSGSKGFHIIIPWKAFPEQIYGQKTKDMFPEWPKAICEYLSNIIQPKLAEKILQDDSSKQIAEKAGKTEQDLVITECLSCNRPAIKKYLITWMCPYCKDEIVMIKKNKRIPKCPNENCRRNMIESTEKEIYFCEFCNISSNKNPHLFAKKRFATEKLIDADLVLVAPRHLFRMPYSLHEKTALASIVLNNDKIQDFQIKDASPFKAEIKNFYPNSEPEEAKELLLQALDYQEQKFKDTKRETIKEITSVKKSEYKQITIPNPDENLFPPCIKFILKGIKQDGRKRALFILLNFLKSLGVEENEIEKRINEWDKKNYNSLKQSYIKSQLNWYRKSPQRLPPNCTNPLYKELAICKPDELCRQIKNPLNYTVKKYFQNR